MLPTLSRIAAAVTALCRAFAVTPEGLRAGRRGNMPPPEGGIAAF